MSVHDRVIVQENKVNQETASRNVIDNATALIDENLSLLRAAVIGVGFVGGVILLRSIKPFTAFTSVGTIPSEFFSKNVIIGVQITGARSDGVLHAYHTPIVQLNLTKRRSAKKESELPLTFAGIQLTELGFAHVKETVVEPARFATVQLLRVNPESSSVDGVVKLKTKIPFKWLNLNANLIRHGFATISPIPELNSSPAYQRLMHELQVAYEEAQLRKENQKVKWYNKAVSIIRWPITLLSSFNRKRSSAVTSSSTSSEGNTDVSSRNQRR